MQYEKLPALFRTAHIWRQVIVSLILNWIIGPFVRLYLGTLAGTAGVHGVLSSLAHRTDHACRGLGNAARSTNL